MLKLKATLLGLSALLFFAGPTPATASDEEAVSKYADNAAALSAKRNKNKGGHGGKWGGCR